MGRKRVATTFPHLFHVLLWNALEAVLKRLMFWVRSHIFFVSTTFLLTITSRLHHWCWVCKIIVEWETETIRAGETECSLPTKCNEAERIFWEEESWSADTASSHDLIYYSIKVSSESYSYMVAASRVACSKKAFTVAEELIRPCSHCYGFVQGSYWRSSCFKTWIRITIQ